MSNTHHPLMSIIRRVSVIAGVALGGACAHVTGPDPSDPSFLVSPSLLELGLGASANIAATLDGTPMPDAELTWSSDDRDVAIVDRFGVVTCVGLGETYIRAQSQFGGGTSIAGARVRCSLPLSPRTLITLADRLIEFEHVRGVTACSQSITPVRLQNVSGTACRVTLVSDNRALVLATTEIDVPAGAGLAVPVAFNCSTTDSFRALVRITAQCGTESQTEYAVVVATIR